MPPLSESALLRADENGLSRLATFISDVPNRLRSMASPLIHPRALATAAPPISSLPKSLVGRQEPTILIPAIYSNMNDSPAPGTVIGAVLGAVFGFLLILWLLYSLFNRNGRGAVVAEEDVVVRERRGSRSRRTETVEVSRSRSRSPLPLPRSPPPARTESRTERVIVEERRVPVPVQREDDIVEVIEEHSPPRRSKDRRSRPTGGYRPVDPDRYAGGNLPVQEVYGKRNSRHGR
ncbi:MAG: hypothetical protein M1816_007876 [Peltula sp. TS41687]|nr:MAG: hypothetical protein M1816_007876 [Peltula sp. TS41687]